MKVLSIKNGKKVSIDAEFGSKCGHSPYIVSKSYPSNKDDILRFFFVATIEEAIKQACRYLENPSDKVILTTGDGQHITVTYEELKTS